jgi:hypothetical protein
VESGAALGGASAGAPPMSFAAVVGSLRVGRRCAALPSGEAAAGRGACSAIFGGSEAGPGEGSGTLVLT